jgi:hypothetical protein
VSRHHARSGAAAAVAGAALLLAASEGGAQLAICDDTTPPALAIVALGELPTGFPSGVYVERKGPGLPDGPARSSQHHAHMRFEPAAAGGRLEHRYDRDERDRDIYGRWPLRFAPRDGAGRLVLTYREDRVAGADCARTVSQVVTPVATTDPGVRLARPRVTITPVVQNGIGRTRVRVTISGTTKRPASRPVRLDVYEGRLIRFLKRVKVRNRRLSATVRFTLQGGSQVGPIRVRARYPGDVRETWPCNDAFFESTPCTKHRTFPQPG